MTFCSSGGSTSSAAAVAVTSFAFRLTLLVPVFCWGPATTRTLPVAW